MYKMNLNRSHLLAVRATALPANSRRHSGAAPTRFQVLPEPHDWIERRWHRVYDGRHWFIEALEGRMRITADLDAWLAEVETCRLGEYRYMLREELLDLRRDTTLPTHDGNPYRIPTGLRVYWRAINRRQPRNRGRNQYTGPAVPNVALNPYWGGQWYRVYRTLQGGATWLYIEVGKPIFTDEERAQRKTGHFCPVEDTKLRRYQGVVRIAPELFTALP